jgi:hypothetical protein
VVVETAGEDADLIGDLAYGGRRHTLVGEQSGGAAENRLASVSRLSRQCFLADSSIGWECWSFDGLRRLSADGGRGTGARSAPVSVMVGRYQDYQALDLLCVR